jgi:hypothetical protein
MNQVWNAGSKLNNVLLFFVALTSKVKFSNITYVNICMMSTMRQQASGFC